MQIKTVRAAFWLKQLLACGLAVLADLALWRGPVGSGLGVLAAGGLIAALIVRPLGRRDLRAWLASAAAALLALALFDHPTLIGWLMFGVAIGLMALSPRAAGGDVWRWSQRLVLAGLIGLAAPFLDLIKLHRTRRRRRIRVSGGLFQLVLPLLGGALFLSLFAAANPVIADLMHRLQLPEVDPGRLAFWGVALLTAWMVLRPRLRRAPFRTLGGAGEIRFPGVTPASVGLSLILFNALFALENGLDIAFLWSGAPLPGHVTLAGYAHKGAYTLIATAVLAGVFVLAALQPGSAMARSRWLRVLVVAWVAQNLLLVASSALRTWDYVEAYSLTRLRIAALVWMGLVGVGLVLICWRMLRGRSASWLVNANSLAAGLVLAACCVVDLGAVAAAWNVRHSSEVDGHGTRLDLDYLKRIGDASLVPLSELLQRPLAPEFRTRVEQARGELLVTLANRQVSRRGWTWRGQRRLEAARVLSPRPAPPPAPALSAPGPG
jgi:hypothetical protein